LEKIHRCDNAIDLRRGRDPARFPLDGRFAFRLEPADYVDVLKEAEASGASVTGVYHSHVDAGAYFSVEDQRSVLHELYPFPDADHIVVSVVERDVKEAALFRRHPRSGCFQAGRLLVPGLPGGNR
jgi:proteasome lid subunit RPN8/RPN11